MSARTAAPDVKSHLATVLREAGRRGLVLELRGAIVADVEGEPAPEAGVFCTVAAAAWAATDGPGEPQRARHAHVAAIIAAVARNSVDRRGAVHVSRTAWVLLRSYAETGRPPKRDEDVAPRRTNRGAR